MRFKKIIATISAAAMLITSAITATADTAVEGKRFQFPLESYVDENIKTSSTYTVEGAKNVVYSFTFDSVGWADAKVRTGDGSDGNRSLRIRGTGTTSTTRGLGAEFTVKFGNPTADGQYVISFDLYREKSSDYDYATLNYDGWDGAARLTGTTKWTVTPLGAGNSIGGTGTGNWIRYTATLSTIADDPQLNFAVANGGELHIDNIIVKDSNGNVLYAEGFESDGPIIAVPEEPEIPDEPEEPEVIEGTRFPFPLESYVDENIKTSSTYTVEGAKNVVYSFTFDSEGWADAKVRNGDGSDGNRSLRIRGTGTTSMSRGLGAEFTVKFGNPTADGKYVISFDLYREKSSAHDYAALNYDGWDGSARLTDTTKWAVTELGAGNSIGGVGTGSWSRYTATLLTFADDPQLNFAVADGGELHIDNIIVKDSNGNVLYAESFESDGPIIAVPEEPEEPEVIEGTRFPFPMESYVDENIKTETTFTVEGTENVVYRFTFEDKGSPDAKVRTADASDGTRSMRIRGSYTTSKSRGLGAEFTIKFGNPTADGKYVISFDLYREQSSDYDYATLNYDGWDGPARLTGTTKWTVTPLGAGNSIGGVGTGNWSRYTATTSTIADDPQLNFAVANGGELHIDNIIVKDTSGNVLYAESFEADGPIIAVPEVDEEPEEPDVDDGTRFPFPLEGLVDENIKTASTYTVEGTRNIVYRFTFDNVGSPDAKVRTLDASDGTRSMRIRGTSTTSKSKGLGAEFTIKFGKSTADGKYVISFDLYRELSSDYDYATLNYDGWDGPARLTGTTKWTVTPLGAGNRIGGVGTGNWSRYTATTSTIADDPQLNFAVAKGGELHIDNIIVKDTQGNVLFAESFEAAGPIITGAEGVEYKIYDVELDVVEKDGDGYKTVETATKLKANTLLMSKLRIENFTYEEAVSAYVYTALFRDGNVIAADRQIVSVEAGSNAISNGVLSIPSLDDGEYTVNVYVWDAELNPIKDFKSLAE